MRSHWFSRFSNYHSETGYNIMMSKRKEKLQEKLVSTKTWLEEPVENIQISGNDQTIS